MCSFFSRGRAIVGRNQNWPTFQIWLRRASKSCLGFEHRELDADLKHRIETHWRDKLGTAEFQPDSVLPKKYVLSQFPYPSGQLHMGHVRVYAISDAMARFYRMTGHNVLHPMGWDAFGLPAENAAMQRGIAANTWTHSNIAGMREQFAKLGCSFDWSREFATCEPEYYRWTQWIFARLYAEGLVYQREALVNWDPVDLTVLADEQVDSTGCSWRSGAKVEKKLLKQWFVRTTRFAKQLLDGLDDPLLTDWRDIIKLQRHWIGDCDGYRFDVPLEYAASENNDSTAELRLRTISLWTRQPEDWKCASFVAVTADHILTTCCKPMGDVLDVRVRNPFDSNRTLPVIVSTDLQFEPGCDTYLGVAGRRAEDAQIASKLRFDCRKCAPNSDDRDAILHQAQKAKIGGWPVSSKLKDWPISRQRNWGTPIPIVHCDFCGTVPIPEASLPLLLTDKSKPSDCQCPKCESLSARYETDTMDTFVDSSWYFFRFMDAHNASEPFALAASAQLAPVDLYVGGKEHAVLHLYYARFMAHFLHSIGRVPQPEPFRRLLVQGMVMGRSFRVKGSGQYLSANEVKVVDQKKGQAVVLETGEPVVMQWEKMSKSKLNGADPTEAIAEHGTDSIRLIMLGDVAPTSHRNWSEATFPGILNWQRRIWLTVCEFHDVRTTPLTVDQSKENIINSPVFIADDAKMNDARNYFLKETTFNFRYSHQLSVAISKLQGLTNAIRRAPKTTIKYSAEYERALAACIQMLAPLAPHFASELWSRFCAVPGRVSPEDRLDLNWSADVLQQRWPMIDEAYKLDLVFKINGLDLGVAKFTADQLRKLTHDQALVAALTDATVQDYVANNPIQNTSYVHYDGCEAVISISVQRRATTQERMPKLTKRQKTNVIQ